jgi:hypothetical protein
VKPETGNLKEGFHCRAGMVEGRNLPAVPVGGAIEAL